MWAIVYWRRGWMDCRVWIGWMSNMVYMVMRAWVWSMCCMVYRWMRNWMWRVCNRMRVWGRMDRMVRSWIWRSVWIMVRILDLWMMCPDHIWWRTNFSSRLALIWSGSLLCCNSFWEERCSIAHTIAVPELPIVPFFLQSKSLDS